MIALYRLAALLLLAVEEDDALSLGHSRHGSCNWKGLSENFSCRPALPFTAASS
jgi:hypothetical protein